MIVELLEGDAKADLDGEETSVALLLLSLDGDGVIDKVLDCAVLRDLEVEFDNVRLMLCPGGIFFAELWMAKKINSNSSAQDRIDLSN